ncbi:MAG: DNA repair protein RecO [Panacagrimonas sp.]
MVSRARIQLEPAWVLKAAPYSDSSLLVEAFTHTRGRIGLVARGARAAKSRSRALLQSFRPLLLSWTEAGDLGTLTGVEAQGAAITLPGECIFSGWYLNELLLRLLQRHDAHPLVFEAYIQAITRLQQATEPSLRRFEQTVLAELGFGLDLPEDLDAERYYRYEPDRGAVPVDAQAVHAIPGRNLIALRDDCLQTAEDLNVARRLLRAALAPHLGTRPLATADALRALRASAARSS